MSFLGFAMQWLGELKMSEDSVVFKWKGFRKTRHFRPRYIVFSVFSFSNYIQGLDSELLGGVFSHVCHWYWLQQAYLGPGSNRQEDAVQCCGCVVTLHQCKCLIYRHTSELAFSTRQRTWFVVAIKARINWLVKK